MVERGGENGGTRTVTARGTRAVEGERLLTIGVAGLISTSKGAKGFSFL